MAEDEVDGATRLGCIHDVSHVYPISPTMISTNKWEMGRPSSAYGRCVNEGAHLPKTIKGFHYWRFGALS